MSSSDEQRASSGVTQLLDEIGRGVVGARDRLLDLVYEELRGMAHRVFGSSPTPHTLQPTALVHEVWMKVAGGLEELNGRRSFFAIAATAMRQVMIDYARGQDAQKRGEGRRAVTLDEAGAPDSTMTQLDLIALDDALTRLEHLHERHARVAVLRFLGGLSIAETASELGVSVSTVEADWRMASAWLRRELSET